MYLDCLNCQKLGESCDGPNFLALTAPQLLDWCKQRKQKLGMTNAKLAELSNTPKGTIDRILSGSYLDYRYETIRPILKVLVGCSTWGENPCDAPEPVADPQVVEKLEQQTEVLRQTKKENYRLAHELDMERQRRENLESGKAERLELIAFLKDQLKSRKGTITALSIALILSLIACTVLALLLAT